MHGGPPEYKEKRIIFYWCCFWITVHKPMLEGKLTHLRCYKSHVEQLVKELRRGQILLSPHSFWSGFQL